jgi:hypothetical protein
MLSIVRRLRATTGSSGAALRGPAAGDTSVMVMVGSLARLWLAT